MLGIQLVVAAFILMLGRFLFYSFIRKDPLWALGLRYGGFLCVTVLSNLFLGVVWTWIWLIGLPVAYWSMLYLPANTDSAFSSPVRNIILIADGIRRKGR